MKKQPTQPINPEQPEKEEGKMSAYLQAGQLFFTYWKVSLVSIVICMIFGGLYAYKSNPLHEIQANVLITDNDTKSDFLRSFSIADMFGTGTTVDDQLALLNSHSLFLEITKKFGLNETYIVKKNFLKRIRKFDNTPVELITPPEFADTLNTQLAFKVKVNDKGLVDVKIKKGFFTTLAEVKDKQFPVRITSPYGDFTLKKTDFFESGKSLNMTVLVSGYNQAAEDLRMAVVTSVPNKKADVINIAYNCPNAEFGKKVVDTIVADYNARGIDENRNRNRITANFIDQRLADVTNELNDIERNVEGYKKDNNLIDLVADAQYIFTKKGTIDQELVKAETETEILQMTRELMNDPNNRYNLIPTPYGAEAAVEAIAQYNELVLERMKLLNNAKTNNNAALRTISGQLDAMRENINATLDRSLASATVKVNDLRKQMQESDSRLGQMPRQEREYLNIKRRQVVQENIYLLLLQHREETNLRMANAIPKGQIIDRAYVLSKQSNLTTGYILSIAFILGLLGCPVVLFLYQHLSRKTISEKDFRTFTKLPVMAKLRTSANKKDVFVDDEADMPERFRELSDGLQFVTPGVDHRVILMTPLTGDNRAAYVGVNVAASLAEAGKKTLLVDMDFDRCGITEYFDADKHFGMSNYIANSSAKPADTIIHSEKHPGLDIAVAGSRSPESIDLLNSTRTSEFISLVKDGYDYVIVSTIPIDDLVESPLPKDCDLELITASTHCDITALESLDSLAENDGFKKMRMLILEKIAGKKPFKRQ